MRPARTRFSSGEPFRLDASYRLCHLPLVAPGHPDAIASAPGKDYAMGVHGPVLSLVLPIDCDALDAEPAWRQIEAELRASPIAPKIAWAMAERRRSKVHATIAGGLTGIELPRGLRERLREIGPFQVRIGGLFSGNINLGRLYLALYPEARDGANQFHRVQEALGRTRTGLYLAGVHNLTDHLDPAEAAWLGAFLDRVGGETIRTIEVRSLALLLARDDLALDSEIVEEVPLG